MKYISGLFLVISAVILSFGLPARAADSYQLDPDHTSVLWHVSHFGFSNPSGKFVGIKGTLLLDEATPVNSNINVTISTINLVTGIDKLDEHLKGKDFFNIAAFPNATFVSDRIDITGKNTAKVHGTLTLLGTVKRVILDVKLNKIGESPITKKKTAGFTATATLKRSDFGMTTFIPGISDEVQLELEAEANQ